MKRHVFLTIANLIIILFLQACYLKNNEPDITATIAEAARMTIEAQDQIAEFARMTIEAQDRTTEHETPEPEQIVQALPPPLIDVEFPSETIDYPDDWPAELILPSGFNLVEIVSGPFPGEEVSTWGAKFETAVPPGQTIKNLESFLSELEWEIVERNELDSGGVEIIAINGNLQGIIITDAKASNPQYTNILITTFSKSP